MCRGERAGRAPDRRPAPAAHLRRRRWRSQGGAPLDRTQSVLLLRGRTAAGPAKSLCIEALSAALPRAHLRCRPCARTRAPAPGPAAWPTTLFRGGRGRRFSSEGGAPGTPPAGGRAGTLARPARRRPAVLPPRRQRADPICRGRTRRAAGAAAPVPRTMLELNASGPARRRRRAIVAPKERTARCRPDRGRRPSPALPSESPPCCMRARLWELLASVGRAAPWRAAPIWHGRFPRPAAAAARRVANVP